MESEIIIIVGDIDTFLSKEFDGSGLGCGRGFSEGSGIGCGNGFGYGYEGGTGCGEGFGRGYGHGTGDGGS